jgi:two-component system cell cycle sensor histidine kinase/response regulator CckA
MTTAAPSSSAPGSSSPSSTAAGGGKVRAPGPRRKVLIVEDEALIALDLERRVLRMGFDVVGTADNCAEAVEVFRDTRPDLVLMDIFIRGPADGIQTARELGRFSDVPVIFITAFADSDTVGRAAEVSPYGYLLKPFDDNTLAATVRVALERHAADTRLRLLSAAVESSQVGIELIALRGNERETVFVNDAFATLHGAPREQWLGKPPSLLARDDAQESLLRLQEAIRNVAPAAGTVQLPGTAEARFDAVTLSTVADRAGNITHLLAIHSDVTRQRSAELALEVSQRMELMGRLTAAIAHDFNNVLGAIVAFAELARDGVQNDVARQDIDEILAAARSGAALTRKLLEFPRANDGDRTATADLGVVLPAFRAVLDRVAGPRIKVAVDLDAVALVATIDAHSLEQVLLNLVTNARDAMPTGGHITIGARRPAAGTSSLAVDAVRITVADDGQGMPEDVRVRSFEPLFTTKPRGKGTGLGLATCKMLIERAGGAIDLVSELGKGTTFTIDLPLAAEAGAAGVAGAAPTSHGNAGGAVCILVDDEAPLRRACARALADVGFHVIEAVDGEQAIREIDARRSAVKLVVSDMLLPGVGGEAVVAHARQVLPAVPTILISGYIDGKSEAATTEDILWKPFPLATLVRRALDAVTTAAAPTA